MPGSRPDRTPKRRADLVEALLLPEAYPHRVEAPVRLIETHISHLFLTGRFVYKVKKPVDLGFLDFTTLDKRRRFTYDELELNRAVSPSVYLGVSEVRRRPGRGYLIAGDGGARTNHEGGVEEYALKMRQLDDGCALASLVRHGRAGKPEIETLGRHVAAFHSRAAPAGAATPFGSPDVVGRLVSDNLVAIRPWADALSIAAEMGRAAAYTRGAIAVFAPAIAARKADRRVRDCHGDLHAGNIFLEPAAGGGFAVEIIDRIEFNDRYRFIDVAADLAFLTMDLKRLERPDLARALVAAYLAEAADPAIEAMLGFYEVYRALVRCKVAVLMLAERVGGRPRRLTGGPPEAESAREYAGLAARLVAEQRPTVMLVMTGVAGSGKSTVARELAARWGVRHVSSDVLRKTLFGIDPHRPSDPAVRDELYSSRMSGLTYRELVREGGEELASGRSVVLDASFLRRDHRKRAREVARRHGVPFVLIECRVADREARARLERRYASGTSESDAGPDLLPRHIAERESVTAREYDGHIVVDTTGDAGPCIDEAEAEIWRRTLATGPAPRPA